MVLAARTNSCCFRLRIWPRTTRAISTQYTLPKATMMLWIPAPSTCMIRITYSVRGMVEIISTIRIMIISTVPPR